MLGKEFATVSQIWGFLNLKFLRYFPGSPAAGAKIKTPHPGRFMGFSTLSGEVPTFPAGMFADRRKAWQIAQLYTQYSFILNQYFV